MRSQRSEMIDGETPKTSVKGREVPLITKMQTLMVPITQSRRPRCGRSMLGSVMVLPDALPSFLFFLLLLFFSF